MKNLSMYLVVLSFLSGVSANATLIHEGPCTSAELSAGLLTTEHTIQGSHWCGTQMIVPKDIDPKTKKK